MEMFLLLVVSLVTLVSGRYEPTWESLDSRPLPTWFDEAKIGIFITWGIYSVPSFGSEWFWYNWLGSKDPGTVEFMKKNYRPDFTYADFAPEFHAEFFDPNQWADIFKSAGAKYIVFTSKHCDGYTNWPSRHSFNWNSMDVGPKRDLAGELANAIRKRTDIKLGLYHALIEWFHPLYLEDKANQFKTRRYVDSKPIPERIELINTYKPDLLWSDGDWEGSDWYWNSTGFLAWLYNDSPVKDTIIVNDRWGVGTSCHHGGYMTCTDRYNPQVLEPFKWENCMTLDRNSWSYKRNVNLEDYLTLHELLTLLAETVSCGGNILIDVGPASDGMISPVEEERLRDLGRWLAVNGEAIYSSKPWTHQNDTVTPDIWYTSKKSAASATVIYAIVLHWPMTGILTLGAVTTTPATSITMLGYGGGTFQWKNRRHGGVDVVVPDISVNQLPSLLVWVFKLENLTYSRQ